jgi:hypothetical protein
MTASVGLFAKNKPVECKSPPTLQKSCDVRGVQMISRIAAVAATTLWVTVVAVAGLAVSGIAGGTASALPGPIPPNCEKRIAVTYCDEPIQADGSWQRCFENQPFWDGAAGTWWAGSNCYQVGPGPDQYPWAPQYHIGG